MSSNPVSESAVPLELDPLSFSHNRFSSSLENTRMYAIAFDLDTEILRQTYGDSPNDAYGEIKRFLVEKGFTWQQGSVYFGESAKINAVTCVLAVNELSKAMPWFAASVRDIRMLRIEENNDLRPALQLGR